VFTISARHLRLSSLRIEDGVVEVIASHGNNHLGGDIRPQDRRTPCSTLKIEHKVDVSGHPQATRGSIAPPRMPKSTLRHPFARIEEEYLAEVDGKPIHLAWNSPAPTTRR